MDDVQRAIDLARMKRVALGLLVGAAGLYIVARLNEDTGEAWGYVRAFSEAAMVGALADWFAVTALFRHPLGIPIPHTAIIPEKKDSLGRALGQFVETNFMSKDVLAERLANIDVGQRLGDWLAEPAHAERASAAVADVIRGAAEVVDDAQIQQGLERMVQNRIAATEVAPLLGKIIDIAIDGGHDEKLLDAVFAGLRGFLDDNRVTFRERLENESPWWVPEAIDNRIFAKIYDGVQRFLTDVGSDPHHEVRASIETRARAFAERLRTDPELIAKGEQVKADLLDHPEAKAWMDSLWADAKRGLIDATMSPTSELRQRMAGSLTKLAQRLRTEPELRAKVDRWVAQALGYVVENYRHEVSRLIESTIARWDGEETARKLELQVGRDLQFIRVNGTLVGGLAGVAIHTIGEVFLS